MFSWNSLGNKYRLFGETACIGLLLIQKLKFRPFKRFAQRKEYLLRMAILDWLGRTFAIFLH